MAAGMLGFNPFANPYEGATPGQADGTHGNAGGNGNGNAGGNGNGNAGGNGNGNGAGGNTDPNAVATTAVVSPETYSVEYVHTDALGSPVSYTSSTGSVLPYRNTRYEPYGTPTTTPRDGEPTYTGHQYDTGTGLIYAQARYYDPALGRFLGPDPMAVDTSSAFNWNRYAYANNSPYKFTDPDGRFGVLTLGPPLTALIIVGGGYYVLTHMPAHTGSTQSDGVSGLLGTSDSSPVYAPVLNQATKPEGQSDSAGEGRRRKNRIPDRGEPGTITQNPPGTTSKEYGENGWVETEWNDGHGPKAPEGEQEDHVHDHIPNPHHPEGRPTRQPGRAPTPEERERFKPKSEPKLETK